LTASQFGDDRLEKRRRTRLTEVILVFTQNGIRSDDSRVGDPTFQTLEQPAAAHTRNEVDTITPSGVMANRLAEDHCTRSGRGKIFTVSMEPGPIQEKAETSFARVGAKK